MTLTGFSHDHYDAVIVGARCAGAATGMLLARRGARVLIVDREPYGSDTMSTHALMRGAVMQLANWGVLHNVAATGAPPVRTTGFIYGDRDPIDIEISPQHGVSALYAPRRFALDKVLVDAARRSGAEVHHGIRCLDLLRAPDGGVAGAFLRDPGGGIHKITAELVVGADGRNSTVAQLAGAPYTKRGTHASRCIYGYFDGLAPRGFRWHWGEGVAGVIIPTNDGQACVFLSLPQDARDAYRAALRPEGFRDAITRLMPQMARELEGGRLVQRLTGFAGEPGYMRQACGDGWALVGDAGYFKDPITAHGITDALRDAQILADSWAAGRLDSYAITRDALSQDMLRLSDTIAAFDWTLPQIAELHQSLNLTMKANQHWIAGHLYPLAEAA
ncbi:MAG TPA: NAD(P)/FAD-dependent oxidoreductase [Erythrobacter sp.]|nr:NAD(P)/FAD-dependent oxidoreductase [Erythrobacter sp.]